MLGVYVKLQIIFGDGFTLFCLQLLFEFIAVILLRLFDRWMSKTLVLFGVRLKIVRETFVIHIIFVIGNSNDDRPNSEKLFVVTKLARIIPDKVTK